MRASSTAPGLQASAGGGRDNADEDESPEQALHRIVGDLASGDDLWVFACRNGVLAIVHSDCAAQAKPWLMPVRFDDCDIPDDIGGGCMLTPIPRAICSTTARTLRSRGSSQLCIGSRRASDA